MMRGNNPDLKGCETETSQVCLRLDPPLKKRDGKEAGDIGDNKGSGRRKS